MYYTLLRKVKTGQFINSTLLLLSAVSACLLCTEGIPLGPSMCNSTGLLYYNSISNSCKTCTNCTLLGLETLTECSLNNDTVCSCPSGHYYHNRTCNKCTNCILDLRYQPIAECTATSDSQCKPCPSSQYYSNHFEKCTLDCAVCTYGCVTPDQCRCLPCQTGRLCSEKDTTSPECRPRVSTTPTTAPTLVVNDDSSQSFSPVSSALIAVGAVLGIIIFSTCFVLLGVVNSCRKTPNNLPTPSDSSNGSIINSKHAVGLTSASLASLYMNRHSPSPLQEYRTSLDLLKYSNNSLYSTNSWSTATTVATLTSARDSPKTSRSNSAPLV